VLDYPRVFTKKDVFAFRTLFWWGKFISFTLHLKGKYLTKHFDTLKHSALEHPTPLYLSASGSEWNHDPSADNYKQLNTKSSAKLFVSQIPFLKIVQLEPIENLNEIAKCYEQFLNQLIVPLCNDRI
jgi:hypothetical protein